MSETSDHFLNEHMCGDSLLILSSKCMICQDTAIQTRQWKHECITVTFPSRLHAIKIDYSECMICSTYCL